MNRLSAWGAGGFPLLVVLGLAACGGGGGGGGGDPTSIAVSPRSISLFAHLPQTGAEQTVHVAYDGDGVVIGYPPGVAQAGWLQVLDAGASAGGLDFSVQASAASLAAGQYSTRLRFLTGRLHGSNNVNDATDISYSDVPVPFPVSDFAVAPAALSYEVIEGSGAQPTPADQRSFTVSADGLNWSAQSDQPWLVLGKSAGDGNATVPFTLNAAGLPLGQNVANIAVKSPVTGETLPVQVTLTVRASRLVVSPASLSYKVDVTSKADALVQSLTLTDELGSRDSARAVHWTVKSIDQAWLSAGISSGTTVPAATVQFSVDPKRLPQLPNGSLTANVVIGYSNADTLSGEVVVPVSLQLDLPRAAFISPYIAYSGTAGETILRGSGFVQPHGIQVLCDDKPPAFLTVVNDTDLRLSCPPMAAGAHLISIPNALGLQTSSARLLVIDHQDLPAATLDIPGGGPRVVYDAERQTLYLGDAADGQLLRYQVQQRQWVALQPIALAGISDMRLSTDGRALLLCSGADLYELDLTNPASVPVKFQSIPPYDGGQLLFQILELAMTDRNVAVVAAQVQGSDLSRLYQYDLSTHLLLADVYPPDANSFSVGGLLTNPSLDGRVSLIATSQSNYRLYDSATDSLSDIVQEDQTVASADVSADRSGLRYISSNHGVFDQNLNLLGRILWNDSNHGGNPNSVVIVSPDGRKAYSYAHNLLSGGVLVDAIQVSDLTAAVTPEDDYPVSNTVDLPIKLSPDYDTPVHMATTLDGNTLFLADYRHLIVIPAP